MENTEERPVVKGLPMRMRRFFRFIVGLAFVVSGLFKLLDPVGAGLVVKEYYSFMHLDFLGFSAYIVALSAALAETLAGAALVTGVFRKAVAWITTGFLGFFTLLNLALVIFNPEMDCGCFGEAIHLTHVQSLLKTLLLDILAVGAFFPYRDFGEVKRRKYVAFAVVSFAILCFAVYSIVYIPIIDYTAYKPGNRLLSAEEYSQEAFTASFVYEKNGVRESFTLEGLPDSTWTYVSTETVKRAGADEFPVLSVYDGDGNYHDSMLTEGDVMAVSVYSPSSLSDRKAEKLVSMLDSASEAGFRPVVLTVAGDAAEGLEERFAVAGVYYSDYKTLISLNRSNGGAVFFNDGMLIKKWARANLPDDEELAEELANDVTDTVLSDSTARNLSFQAFLLYIFAVMLLL